MLREASPGAAVPARAAEVPPPAGARVGAARAPREATALPGALFAGLLVLGVLPVWAVTHFPTQDGGNHVEAVLGLLRLPGSALLQHYYLPNYGLQPNWLTQIVLAALVQVVSPAVAEKLILSGYLVLLPLAFRAALPATPRGRWVALAVFPFLHSYPFHMGFWNFSYSLALFFVAVGWWYRRRGRLDLRRGLAFSGLMLALFVAHSVSTASALAAMGSVLAWRCGLAAARAWRRPARRRRVIAGYLRRALSTGLFALPTVALMGAFLARQPRTSPYRPPVLDYLKHFAGLYALVSFDRRELLVSGAVSLVLGAAVVAALRARATRRLRPVDGWLAAAAVATAVYFATPDAVNDGAQLTDRMNLYPFLAAALWLGFAAVPRRVYRAAALALAVVFVAGTALRLARYRLLDGYLQDYASVTPHVPEGSTILPLTFAPFGPRQGGLVDGKKLASYRVQPFTHAAGYVAAARDGVDLDNSQANTRHTPLRWRDELNPFHLMNTHPFGMESEPPCVELWTYPALGGRIDAVLVWGATAAAERDECGAALLRELRAGYERVFVSPRGMLELYRPLPAGRAGQPPAAAVAPVAAALPAE